MAQSLGSLRSATWRRLGDPYGAVWTATEVDLYLNEGYEEIAQSCRAFWDWVYLENLPRGLSHTQTWESAYLGAAGFDYGAANYTASFERTVLTETSRNGPGNHTSPFEATAGHLSDAGASTAIPGTSEVPDGLTEASRATWDGRGINALSTRDMRNLDSRYRETAGEVYGFLWEFDGVRALRKVRVPSQQASTETITGSWGGMREVADISSDTVTGSSDERSAFTYTQAWERTYLDTTFADLGWVTHTATMEDDWTVFVTDDHIAGNHTATFEAPLLSHVSAQEYFTTYRGLPRRIAGQHPIGPERFGAARRPYLDGTNFRLEHWRQGRAMTLATDVCELPDRYALYLRDYAQAKCYQRAGPGQDTTLAAHFLQRWARGVKRIQTRMAAVTVQRVSVLGGNGASLAQRPPRPSLPWQYGSVMR